MSYVNPPLVSVIVSCYNVEQYVLEAVDSVLNQTYTNLEIIIADDGSTDKTKSIIDSIADSRIKRFHNEVNSGLLYTWNKLLPLTQGAYITFQDADDISLPERIERLVLFLESNPDVGLCGTNFIRYFPAWGLYQKSNYPLSDEAIREEIRKKVIPFNGTRVMIRRNVYLSVGGFREFFKGLAAEDFDWILRIADQYKVSNIADVVYEYRYFSRSASKYSIDSPLERIYVSKILFFLAEQREKFGADALQTGRIEQIQEFLIPYREKLLTDKTNYTRFDKVFGNALANKDFGNASLLLIRRLVRYPLQLTNLHDLYRLISGYVRTVIKAFVFKLSGKSKYNSLDS